MDGQALAENMQGSVTAKGQVEMLKAWGWGEAEHSLVMKGDCWEDIKETETSPASLGRLFCGMRDLGKSNCFFFFASSYVKHTQSSHRGGVSAAGYGEAEGN